MACASAASEKGRDKGYVVERLTSDADAATDAAEHAPTAATAERGALAQGPGVMVMVRVRVRVRVAEGPGVGQRLHS